MEGYRELRNDKLYRFIGGPTPQAQDVIHVLLALNDKGEREWLEEKRYFRYIEEEFGIFSISEPTYRPGVKIFSSPKDIFP